MARLVSVTSTGGSMSNSGQVNAAGSVGASLGNMCLKGGVASSFRLGKQAEEMLACEQSWDCGKAVHLGWEAPELEEGCLPPDCGATKTTADRSRSEFAEAPSAEPDPGALRGTRSPSVKATLFRNRTFPPPHSPSFAPLLKKKKVKYCILIISSVST